MIIIFFWQTDRSLYFYWRHLDDQEFSKLFEKSGYEVIRVPGPQGFDHRLPGGDNTHTALYANSLMMNNRIQTNAGGAINCSSKEIPDETRPPLRYPF